MYKGICKSFENFWMGVWVRWVLEIDKKLTFSLKKVVVPQTVESKSWGKGTTLVLVKKTSLKLVIQGKINFLHYFNRTHRSVKLKI